MVIRVSKSKKKAEQGNAETKAADKPDEDLVLQLKRLQAEFENYQKRTEREQEHFRTIACAGVIERLLPVLDNFELALKNAGTDNFAKGVELVYAQLVEALSEYGLEPINPINEPFDPQRHEALLTEESDQQKNTIIEVLQKGYSLNGKLIRSAKVKVAR